MILFENKNWRISEVILKGDTENKPRIEVMNNKVGFIDLPILMSSSSGKIQGFAWDRPERIPLYIQRLTLKFLIINDVKKKLTN